MTTLYEIRHAVTGWKLLANATEREVRRYFEKNKAVASSNRKIDGVIVIYVNLKERETPWASL